MLDLSYGLLPYVLAGYVKGFLCLDHRSKGLSVGWGHFLERMIVQGTWYSWGSYMLAHLYHDLHRVVYLGATNLSTRVTLLQIWAWEHMAVTCPLTNRYHPTGRPYVYGYTSVVVQ